MQYESENSIKEGRLMKLGKDLFLFITDSQDRTGKSRSTEDDGVTYEENIIYPALILLNKFRSKFMVWFSLVKKHSWVANYI